MSMVENLTKKFGEKAMSETASRGELYGMVDMIMEEIKSHQSRLHALEDEATRPQSSGAEHA